MLNSRFNSRLPDLDQLWILRFPKIREAVFVSADGLNSDDSETVIIVTFSDTVNWNLEITEKEEEEEMVMGSERSISLSSVWNTGTVCSNIKIVTDF